MSCDGLEVVKTADAPLFWTSEVSTDDYSDWTARFQVRASEGASGAALLDLTETPTGNGSYARAITSGFEVLIKSADLDLLPDASPVSEPWEGVFQLVVTDPDGVANDFDSGVFVAKQGVVR